MLERCWAFCTAYNEAVLIPYWVRHYRTFCERAIVYVDTDTDDGTAEIAEREGADVRPYASNGHMEDMALVAFAQAHYPEARGRARWFVWVDADEFLWHPRMTERLDELAAAGVTWPTVQGYSMLAEAPPTGAGHIYDEIRYGTPSTNYSKPCIFDPGLDIRWGAGKHDAVAAPTDAIMSDDGGDPLRLLHYRYLGAEWHVARNARNYARLTPEQRGSGLGMETYPGFSGPYSPAWYAAQLQHAQEVVPA